MAAIQKEDYTGAALIVQDIQKKQGEGEAKAAYEAYCEIFGIPENTDFNPVSFCLECFPEKEENQ